MKYLCAYVLFAAVLWPATVISADNNQDATTPSGFYVASWNAENLFDTTDDPDNRYDDEFLPSSPETEWTPARLETKLTNLARVIAGMNGGEGPDILGLEEVEHEHLVEQLVKKLDGKSYGIAYAESPDRRGIDTGLIYNRDLFSFVSQQSHRVELPENMTTRDVFHATLKDKNGQAIHVFVNHWPSRSGGVPRTASRRYAAARVLSKAITSVFESDSNAYIIAVGDFNDEPFDRSLRRILKGSHYPSRGANYDPSTLYNLASRTAERKEGSYYSPSGGRDRWKMYDQIIVSGTLLNAYPMTYDADPFEVIRPAYALEQEGSHKGAPVRTYGQGSRYIGGYSDHLPVGAGF